MTCYSEKEDNKNNCVLIDSYEEDINFACDGVPHDQCENKLKKLQNVTN